MKASLIGDGNYQSDDSYQSQSESGRYINLQTIQEIFLFYNKNYKH